MCNFIVRESDERMQFLNRFINQDADQLTRLVGDKYRQVYVFAPNIKLQFSDIENLLDNSALVCGAVQDNVSDLLKNKNITHFNIASDDNFQKTNSYLTAEGTLYHILQNTTKSLRDINCLIIGFGKCGSALSLMFNQLDIKTTIATKGSKKQALAFGDSIVSTTDLDLAGYDVIINTSPVNVLDHKTLDTADHSALLIELVTNGVLDIAYANNIGLNAMVCPALPAKTSPYSAGYAIFEYIKGVLI